MESTNNKLIAEFMGAELDEGISYGSRVGDYFFSDGSFCRRDELKYHTSWDWLMPVVQKCFDTQQPSEGQHYFINESLLTMDIEVVYDRVVEFIKQYNDE